MRTKSKVLVVGDVMLDVIAKAEGPIVTGADRRATVHLKHGGSGANQAIWLGHMGVPTSFAAKVNSSDVGTCEALLKSFGVTPLLSADAQRPTGVLVSVIDPDGQRSFLTDRGANDWLEPSDLPDALLDDVSLLQISGYALVGERSRAAVLDLKRRALSRGIMLSVDPSSASFLEELGPSNFLLWTEGADLCFPNSDEAAVLTGETKPAKQAEHLGRHFGLTVIKRGQAGAEAVDSTGHCVATVAAPQVNAIDTTGAGDAFLAGFLATWISGAGIEGCLKNAVAAGSEATRFFGAQPEVAAPQPSSAP